MEITLTSIDILKVPLLMAVIPLIGLLSVVLSHCFFKKWLTTTPMIANTLKRGYSVLNYARETK